MADLKETKKSVRKMRKEVRSETDRKFKQILRLLERQIDIHTEFIISLKDLNIKVSNNNQFFIIVTSFSDAIRSSHHVTQLVRIGEYNSALSSLRTIFESMIIIERIKNKPEVVDDWFEYNDLLEKERISLIDPAVAFSEEDKAKLKELKTKFAIGILIEKPRDENQKKNYEFNYSFLSSYTHTSLYRFKNLTNFQEKTLMIAFGPVMNNQIASYTLESLFVMMRDIFNDFCSIFDFDKDSKIMTRNKRLIKDYENYKRIV